MADASRNWRFATSNPIVHADLENGPGNAWSNAMNTNSISLSAGSDLQSLIAMQATDKQAKNSSASNSSQTSAFAQMLGAASASGSSANTAAATNPSQLLNQMIASYETTSVQNQGSSLDPMSIAA